MKCLLHMPRTNYHDEPENPMEKLFYGRIRIERATALMEFKKGSPYQKILHQLKYKGMKELGELMGQQLAHEIKNSEFIQPIDLICPVPLHPKKERKRGYNQSFHFAKGLAEILDIPIDSQAVRRRVFTSTQTQKSRFDRWLNVDGIFELTEPEAFNNKHVLLVDDVVTTGATLEACAQSILSSSDSKVSVATLAIA
ncbi:MAG TPA: phosphoribosyltransferase family protein [Sunxiuqinia sp.]|nr:phosphoribosyltransferase family protein [Sunxiuqinia sp.]